MALTKFGFIVTGDAFVQYQGTEAFSMKVVGVRHPSEGVEAAKEMVAEGIQLIELCGGFSPACVRVLRHSLRSASVGADRGVRSFKGDQPGFY